MRARVFVHNLVEGLPNEANQALTNLIDANPGLTIGTLSIDGLKVLLRNVGRAEIDELFAASEFHSFTAVNPSDLHTLLKGIAAADPPSPEQDIKIVPAEKIDYNRLGKYAPRH